MIRCGGWKPDFHFIFFESDMIVDVSMWNELLFPLHTSYIRTFCWVYADKYLVDTGGRVYRKVTGTPIVGDARGVVRLACCRTFKPLSYV